MKKFLGLVAVSTLISACGGGGNSGTSVATQADTVVSYSDLRSTYDRIRLESARVTTEQGYTNSLPSSGSASFSGVASFSENASPQILANANLTADFSESSISGALTDFRSTEGAVFNGSMSISNGSFSPIDGSVTADINGQLTSNLPRMATVDAEGSFVGYFIGDNHRYVRGLTSAAWTTNAGMASEELINMQGELATEKQY